MLKGGSYSIINNVPATKITNDGSIANVEADQPEKFALIQGNDVAMLRLSHLNEDMSNMKYNMIAYGKGLQKESREIYKSFPEDRKERCLIGIK